MKPALNDTQTVLAAREEHNAKLTAQSVGICNLGFLRRDGWSGLGEYLTYIRPNIFLFILLSVNMVLMSILGDKGTIAGPVVGAILIVAFNEIFVATLGTSEINILATGLIMALTLMFFPLGIVGTLAKIGRLPKFLNWD